jgi:hypothetical protein
MLHETAVSARLEVRNNRHGVVEQWRHRDDSV